MSRVILHERVNNRADLYVLLAITSTRICFVFLMFYTLDSLHVLLEENILELKICLKSLSLDFFSKKFLPKFLLT